MLNMKQSMSITGTSVIDDKNVERFTASIDTENPEDMSLGEVIIDKDMYRDNREQCHADQAEFEDAAFSVQEEMIKTNAKKRED